MLDEDAGGGGVKEAGEGDRRQHNSGAVGQAAAGQQKRVVCNVRVVADVLEAAQLLARQTHQPLKKPPWQIIVRQASA